MCGHKVGQRRALWVWAGERAVRQESGDRLQTVEDEALRLALVRAGQSQLDGIQESSQYCGHWAGTLAMVARTVR
jgi:hypothetical protein